MRNDLPVPAVPVCYTPTGVAAFNVGFTLHSLNTLHLPTLGEFKAVESEQLQQLQQNFSGVDYLIIDEMSMLGRKFFGQVNQRHWEVSRSSN